MSVFTFFETLQSHLSDFGAPSSNPFIWASLFLLVTFTYFRYSQRSGNKTIDAPIIGSTQSLIARWTFFFNAREQIEEGYSKYHSGLFKLSGHDMVMLPTKFLDELRDAPEDEISSTKALTAVMEGIPATSILAESNLHSHVLRTKFTPKLGTLIPTIRSELEYALAVELPHMNEDWVSIEAFPLLIHLVGRVSSRLFVGPEVCRDMAWLTASRGKNTPPKNKMYLYLNAQTSGFTHNTFVSIVILRMFPQWLKPYVAPLLPSVWLVKYHLYKARRVLEPLISKRRKDRAAGIPAGGQKFDDMLHFMDNEATGADARPDKLSARALVLTLASAHTTSMAACQALFQMCEHPEYIPELREEVRKAVEENQGWHKTTLTKLRKLDSFIKESQRLHPPNLLGFKRLFLKEQTLSDGTVVPEGARTQMAIQPHQLEDPSIPDPEVFDGFRYFRMRQQEGHSDKHQFSTTDPHSLHFGRGKYACPGRFFASAFIKLVLGHILLEFDIRFPVGQGRPQDVWAYEFISPDPNGKVELRPRA
ncbi:MAG: hypothetical protein Q9168_001850 [Polycauliona sp. 1 TL-2023]